MSETKVTVKLVWKPAHGTSGFDLFFGGRMSDYWVYQDPNKRWRALDMSDTAWNVGTFPTKAQAKAAVEAAAIKALEGEPQSETPTR